MHDPSRRAWLALAGTSLLSACGGGGGDAGSPTTPATAVTLTGPDSGAVNASATFTVGVNGTLAASVVVTPSASAGTGSFSPTSVTLTPTAPSATFAYTPASTGARTIAVTNNQGLSNPSGVAFTASTASGNPSFANVASGLGSDGVTRQSTSSVTLRANRLALLSVVNVASVPNVPTVAGWALVATHVVGDINRVSVFRRMASTDATQSWTIDFGGQSQFYNRWSIDQSGAAINTSGTNGSGAIVQVKTGGQVGVVQNCLITFDAAFASASHSTFAAFGGSVSSATPTPGSGFTELSRAGVEPFGERALYVQYKPAPDTTADMAWSSTYDVWTGIAIEIAA